jgi:hypothetical protein
MRESAAKAEGNGCWTGRGLLLERGGRCCGSLQVQGGIQRLCLGLDGRRGAKGPAGEGHDEARLKKERSTTKTGMDFLRQIGWAGNGAAISIQTR